MRKKNLTKAVETTVAPNPKEVDIWVEPKDDDTVSLKYYDYHDKEWKGNSGSGSSDGVKWEYYRIDWDKANDIIATCDYAPIYRSTLANAKTSYGYYIIGQTSLVGTGEFSYKNIIKIGCISDTKEIVKEISTGNMDVYEGSTWLDFIKKMLIDITDWSWLIPITEEEFYTMNDDEYPNPDANMQT